MCGHLGGRPHRHLLAGGVDDRRARLHEGRDEPLLAVLALDDDAVLARLGDGRLDVAAGARRGGVELPERRLVRAEVGVRQHLVLAAASLSVEHRRQLVVVDVDELGCIPRGRGDCARRRRRRSRRRRRRGRRRRQVGGRLLLGVERPGVDVDALDLGEVPAGEDPEDAGGGLRRGGVDGGDRSRGRTGCAPWRGAAFPGSWMLSVQLVRPVISRRSSLRLRAWPISVCGAVVDGGHDATLAEVTAESSSTAPPPAAIVLAQAATALTMLW